MDACELTDTELKVMRVLWRRGEATSRDLVEELGASDAYSPSTTYALIYRLIKKGAVDRRDPGFVLRPLVDVEDVQVARTSRLVDELFDGSVDRLFAALVDRGHVSREALGRIHRMIDEYEAQAGED